MKIAPPPPLLPSIIDMGNTKAFCCDCGLSLTCRERGFLFELYCYHCNCEWLYTEDVNDFTTSRCSQLMATKDPHHHKGFTFFTGIFSVKIVYDKGRSRIFADRKSCVTKTKNYSHLTWEDQPKFHWE